MPLTAASSAPPPTSHSRFPPPPCRGCGAGSECGGERGWTGNRKGHRNGRPGTAAAYIGVIAYSWDNPLDSLSELSSVPTISLLIILVGMPLAAVIAGWLLAGREPPAIAHQPIE